MKNSFFSGADTEAVWAGGSPTTIIIPAEAVTEASGRPTLKTSSSVLGDVRDALDDVDDDKNSIDGEKESSSNSVILNLPTLSSSLTPKGKIGV